MFSAEEELKAFHQRKNVVTKKVWGEFRDFIVKYLCLSWRFVDLHFMIAAVQWHVGVSHLSQQFVLLTDLISTWIFNDMIVWQALNRNHFTCVALLTRIIVIVIERAEFSESTEKIFSATGVYRNWALTITNHCEFVTQMLVIWNAHFNPMAYKISANKQYFCDIKSEEITFEYLTRINRSILAFILQNVWTKTIANKKNLLKVFICKSGMNVILVAKIPLYGKCSLNEKIDKISLILPYFELMTNQCNPLRQNYIKFP